MQKVQMGEMTVQELRAYLRSNRTVVLPYGVVEQHGYHLPLDTDIRNASVLGEKIAGELGCIVAPVLNYCFSGGLLEGTINVKPNTFSNLIGEIIESLVRQGFENIIIIPGHGGSESLFHLKESLRILKWLNPALKDTLIMLVPPWDFSPTWLEMFKSQDYHAGAAETSLIKYWTPEAVRDKIVLDETEVAEMLRNDPDSYQRRASFTTMGQEIPLTEQRVSVKVGVMGNPECANAATGEKITCEIIEGMISALRQAIDTADESRRTGQRVELNDDNKLKILSL